MVIALAVILAGSFVFCRGCAREAVYPADRARVSLVRAASSLATGVFRGVRASFENARLRREVASLAVTRTDNERLEAENARLRALLGYRETARGRWLAAPVLASGGGAAGVRRTIRVGRGSLDGVAEGAAATVPEGLVGRVVSVSLHTSEVLLVTDPGLSVACRVEGLGGVSGVLSGRTDDSLALRYVKGLGDGAVPSRARVLTSGRGGLFPADIPVGVLLDVHDDARGLAKEGEVLPTVDFSTLEDVFIRCEK